MSPISYPDDYERFDSDEESTSDVKEEVDKTSIDHWFGKKYFECVLAEQLLQTAPPSECASSIEAKLQDRITNYGYLRVLKRLRSEGINIPKVSRRTTAYEIFIGEIGRLLREDEAENSRFVLAMIRSGPINGSEQSDTITSQSTTRTFRAANSNSDSGESPTPILGSYTTALKQRGDELSFIPNYTISTVSIDPAKFKAALSFGDVQVEGVGRTKKQAKHEASKAACERIGLEVS